MTFRRIVGVALVLAIAGMLSPATLEAEAFAEPRLGPGEVDPGFFTRVLEWVQGLLAQLSGPFVAQQGASVTGNG